ncbi:AcrR family transcriptional regulator [Parvibaculum indicum]|uniref:TetR/AcrR family transcriptional regulator n=1 Tax=Parvibaculum indicum TaxID=562969 RepID=UPI00142081B7|nr:TetR family transcriptional regulator C-terminal domain-containing protein [Parvibaculum indicum]NIJ40322.1 AcrR family transcriptional regulator [Parvibaculum indicum]
MPKLIDHDLRRRELVEASWQVIADEGLEGVTMRKVAAAARCTTGRITHYFENREELLLAALRAVYSAAEERLVAAAKSDLPPAEKLLLHLEEASPLDKRRLREWKVWIAFWAVAASTPELAAENDRSHLVWRKSLVPLIEELAPGVDAAMEADLLSGIVDGLGLQAAVNFTPANRARVRDTLATHIAGLERRN